ncbi:U4/U6 x U5 tri-snRNP complex subunit Prp1 [Lecanora helva]
MSGRKDFLSQAAPENYVAGLGRGATGFTTRSDLGPAREGPSEDQIKEALAKRAQQLGAAPPTAYGATEKKEEPDEDDERFQDPENETGLFSGGNFDAEDDAADRIYQDVDERMEKRRKSRRLVSPSSSVYILHPLGPYGLSQTFLYEQITDLNPSKLSREAREAQERAEYEANNPKIQQQFADLKRGLASVSEEDWANIPEAGDLTRKNKRSKTSAYNSRFYAVPDSVIAGARDAGQMDTTVNDDGAATNGSGADNVDGTMTNFADIGAARDKVLQVRLDQAAQSGNDTTSGTSTNIDPKGYLTSLSKTELKAGEVEVGDINRVRTLLESVIKTNSRHGPGYIALARLEEVAGKVVAARKAIAIGTEMCPNSEAVWMEAMRLNDNHNAKIIAAKGIQANPQSTALFIGAADLESVPGNRQRVLRRAIDALPKSEKIWRELINGVDDPSEAKLLTAKAVEEIPLSVDLWLGLARLEVVTGNPMDAQKVLNRARIANPTSFRVWIAAARLAEETGKGNPKQIIKRAVQSLARENAMLKREEWITEAEKLETEGGAVLSLQAIIEETLGFGVDEDDDRKLLFLEDSQASIARGKHETARAINAYALRVFPTSERLWKFATEFERNNGSEESESQLLEKACEACPSSVHLWLALAKAKRRGDDGINESRRVLARAFNQLSSNEDIYLAAVELEANTSNNTEARGLLQTAREQAGTDRVWYKSVAFERQQGNIDIALDLCISALQLYPKQAKLHMQKGQIYQSQSKIPQAREAYNIGTRACPTSVPLFLLLSRLEEASGVIVKARSVLERGIMNSPKSAELRLEAIRVERRAGNIAQAKVNMAKALQALPTSGILWSESIWHLEPRTQRKPRSLEAIKKCDNDPTLFVTVARVFWGERKLEKAANWFEKAILLDADLGDTWAWYLKFLMQHGEEGKIGDTVAKCVGNEPRHGEVWQGVAKDPGNAGLGVEGVLRKTVKLLE